MTEDQRSNPVYSDEAKAEELRDRVGRRIGIFFFLRRESGGSISVHASSTTAALGTRESPGWRATTMASGTDLSTEIQLRLDRLRSGDESARDELLDITRVRLGRLARKMLQGYPGVRRWEQTDDILQNVALRLCRALKTIRPESVHGFVRLAALQIRRELIDLARHYDGPEGCGRHHAQPGRTGRRGDGARPAGFPVRHRRPGPAGDLVRVPRNGRVPARRRAGGLRPPLVSGTVSTRGRRAAGGHRAGGQAPLALGPAQAP